MELDLSKVERLEVELGRRVGRAEEELRGRGGELEVLGAREEVARLLRDLAPSLNIRSERGEGV